MVIFMKATLLLLLFSMLVSACGSSSTENEATNADSTTTEVTKKELPKDIIMKSIPGGTFIMGNDALKGPQAGKATEHSVSLSDFLLSETEITNAQYTEFLNNAFSEGLIEVTTISDARSPDYGKRVVIGTQNARYANKILYSLDGTRVMKDHDNADNDNDPFTGTIEPENPLNIAYIGFNQTTHQFYVKNPYSASDFNWYELCNYYNYASTTKQLDQTVQLNDFNNWSELAGWSYSNPTGTNALPTQQEVAAYPVTFIRWWGAKAFTEYYNVTLPTEAQWEYAAKGGSNFFYAVYDGTDTSDANWNSQNSHPATHHVRAAKSGNANPYGLYNLGGNVWEWVADNFQAYESTPVTDPLIEVDNSTIRSWRGGSWNYHQATLEASARYYDEEDRGNDHFGFRIATK